MGVEYAWVEIQAYLTKRTQKVLSNVPDFLEVFDMYLVK
jgi:hypothetical protein